MLLILIALILAAVVSWILFYFCDDYFIGFLAGALLTVATGVGAICYAFAGWSWIASEHKTVVINREYGTNYTREEIFWASDVIDTIREIDRKRVEVNGDIMRGDIMRDDER